MKKYIFSLILLTIASIANAANVSTIAVASSTVTVTTSAAHGFAVNTGICFSSPGNVCTVVETVPTSTTFTFTQPSTATVAACAASCGTVVNAPQVIILETSQPNQASLIVHYLLWLTTIKPIPASFTSAWKSGAGSAGATVAMNNALSAGSFLEKNLNHTFPSSLSNSAIQVFLQNDYTTQQAALAANTQPGQYYGSIWNGNAWSVQ